MSLSLPQLLRDALHWGDTFEDEGSVFEGAWVGGGLGFSPEGRWNKGVLWAWLMWGQSRDTHRAVSAPHLSSASSVFPTMICLSLSGSSAPAAASSLPSDVRPAPSSASAQTPSQGPNPAPLAVQPRQELPMGDHPPVLPGAATTTSKDLEARVPVQESVSRARVGWGHKGPFGFGMGSLW